MCSDGCVRLSQSNDSIFCLFIWCSTLNRLEDHLSLFFSFFCSVSCFPNCQFNAITIACLLSFFVTFFLSIHLQTTFFSFSSISLFCFYISLFFSFFVTLSFLVRLSRSSHLVTRTQFKLNFRSKKYKRLIHILNI